MCVCNCTHREMHALLVAGILKKPGLFNWVTILLVTGWILVVAFALNTAEVQVKSEVLTDRAFIEKLL